MWAIFHLYEEIILFIVNNSTYFITYINNNNTYSEQIIWRAIVNCYTQLCLY